MFSLIETIVTLVTTILSTIGLAGLFGLMTVESFGFPPLPSEVILPFTGFLIATGQFPLIPAIVIALAGGLAGSFIAYAVGRWWRHRIVDIGVGRFRLEARHLARMDEWFIRHGESTVGLSRLVPVIRSYISYPAGSAKMPAGRFGVYTLLGSIPFTLAFIYAGMVLGSHWTRISQDLQYVDYALIALIVVGAIYAIVLLVRWARTDPPAPVPPAPDPPGTSP